MLLWETYISIGNPIGTLLGIVPGPVARSSLDFRSTLDTQHFRDQPVGQPPSKVHRGVGPFTTPLGPL